jgi:hypothetical protein
MSDLMELLLGTQPSLKESMGEDMYNTTKARLGTVLVEKDSYLLTEKEGHHYLLAQGDATELHIGIPDELSTLVLNMANAVDFLKPPEDAGPIALTMFGQNIKADFPLTIPMPFGSTLVAPAIQQCYEEEFQSLLTSYIKSDIEKLKKKSAKALHPFVDALEEAYLESSPPQSPYLETLLEKAKGQLPYPEYKASVFVPLSDLEQDMHTLKHIYGGLKTMAALSPLTQVLSAGKALTQPSELSDAAQAELTTKGYTLEQGSNAFILKDAQGNQTLYQAFPDGEDMEVNSRVLVQQINEGLEEKIGLLNMMLPETEEPFKAPHAYSLEPFDGTVQGLIQIHQTLSEQMEEQKRELEQKMESIDTGDEDGS